MEKRKRRSDRNHIIYKIENSVTGEFYIGITAVSGRAYLHSLKSRWKKHLSRWKTQNPEWNLYKSMTEYGETHFKPSIIEVIRGKAEAHLRECQLIKTLRPTLNTTSI
jgi:hypothetical protein